MDFLEKLKQRPTAIDEKEMIEFIGDDEVRFSELMEAFFSENWRINQSAAHLLSKVADKHPQLLQPYVGKLIQNLHNPHHDAVKRNTVRVLQFQSIPEEYHGELAEKCFGYLQNYTEPVAVKVFSMTVLSNLVKDYPELKTELIFAIEEQLPYASAGFQSRGKKVLKQLRKV